MRTYTSVIIVAIFFTHMFSWGQHTIAGKLTNNDGSPISNATLFITPTNMSAISDKNGAYAIEGVENGNYLITIQIIGYHTVTNKIDVSKSIQDLNFELTEDVLMLESVVVTGTFDKRTGLSSGTSISIVDPNDYKLSYASGTASLLQHVAGTFTDASAGEVFTKVYSRGISASAEDDMGWYYVALQEDGLPVSLIQHSYYSPDLFHRVDLMTKKFEAVRGGKSVITATNAPGGIYNFLSHDTSSSFEGEGEFTSGTRGASNFINRFDLRLSGPIGNDWYFNAGGHYRVDEGARGNNFPLSEGGQFKFNLIKKIQRGKLTFFGKILVDKTNRYTGVAAQNWENPTAAYGQDFNNTSLLMPAFNGEIPDSRNLNNTLSFNPTQGIHAKDLTFGFNYSEQFGENAKLTNKFKISSKQANWQTSISNAFVSLNNPLAYFISGAAFPVGQIVFRDAKANEEIARVDNSGLFSGNPFQYITAGNLPNDAIMGTSAWYKDNDVDEWMNHFEFQQNFKNHTLNAGTVVAHANTSHFTQGTFAYVTYEPNPKMLSVYVENPGQPTVALSDSNGLSNYGGLFFVDAQASVEQYGFYINDKWDVNDTFFVDMGLRYDSILHKGDKKRYAPSTPIGGIDGDTTTAYDNGILVPTGDIDAFNFKYSYLSYSLGINQKLDSKTTMFARFSSGNKAPELNYYFNNFANVPIANQGEIQKIHQAELGIKVIAEQYSATGTLFWSQLDNIGIANFEFDDSTNTVFYTPIPLNTSSTVGFEWETAYTAINNIHVKFNGILQNPIAKEWSVYDASGTAEPTDDITIDYSGNQLAFNPKMMSNLSLVYEKDNFNLYYNWHHMGKRFGNVANAFELDAYSIFNFGGGCKITKRITASFEVSNLFNSAGLANFFGDNSFGASANGVTRKFVADNPNSSFVVVPILPRSSIIRLNYSF
ncbi:MAG: TonB-dependent receptor [Bacteroidetes bacterium]|nr:TonB-dependent receptor [Bacteroidota bacterium]